MTQGERVRTLRKALHLTLEKFGKTLGVGKTAISKIENQENNLTDQMIISICREYSVDEKWLRTGEGEMFCKPSDEIGYYVEDLLEYSGSGNPFFDMIINMMKTYHELDDTSKEVIRGYFEKVQESIGKEKKED